MKNWYKPEIVENFSEKVYNSAIQINNSAKGCLYNIQGIQENIDLKTNEKVIWELFCSFDLMQKIKFYKVEK